jgi:hypothetical protein
MNPSEIRAYNAGVLAVLDIARVAAESIGTEPWKPTRGGAAGALEELAKAGRALLINDGGPDGEAGGVVEPASPNGDPPSHGSSASAIAKPDAERDGKFSLTDEEIARPTRRILADWLSGRTPMLASNWSRRAAQLLEANSTQVSGSHPTARIEAHSNGDALNA